MYRVRSAVFLIALAASGCAGTTGMTLPSRDAGMVAGPPIRDVVTTFDAALGCLRGKVDPRLAFAVGAIIDHTGKEQLTEGGAGKFITQGAGDIVQSALFKAGVTVVNRRDPRVMTTEVQWNIRDPRRIVPTNYYITGSINSLDFIPGGGFDVSIAGAGPRYRQNRLVATESGFGMGRFFGETLVSLDIGGKQREALHFALRHMLNLATFELLTQVMSAQSYAACRAEIDSAHGRIENTGTAAAIAAYEGQAVQAQPAVVRQTAPAPAAVPAVARSATPAPLGPWGISMPGFRCPVSFGVCRGRRDGSSQSERSPSSRCSSSPTGSFPTW